MRTPVPTPTLTGEMFVGPRRVLGPAGFEYPVNPATGERLEPRYGMDDGTAVTEACRLAGAVFDEYRRVADDRRAALLRTIASNLEAHGDAIVHCVHQETALAPERVRGELARTTGQLRVFADLLGDPSWCDPRRVAGDPDRRPAPRPELRSRRIAVGPVAVFGASNFPLAFSVAGGDTASALAAGCPVVVKGHPAHLRTSELIGACVAAAVAETGMPDGVFSLVFGSGTRPGAQLVSDPRIAAVGFTGSRAGGLALLAAAQRRPVPIPVFAEMSSTNPVFVLPGALAAGPQALAAGFLGSMTASAGQLCTSPGQLFAVPGLGFDKFRAALTAGLAATPPATMLTAAIAAAYDDGIRRWTARPATTALGGGRTTGATVVQTGSAQFLAEPALRDEVFGTAAVLVSCLEPAELLVVAESLDGQLTATIHTTPEDAPLARALLTVLERKAGRVIVNGWPTGVEVGPATIHGGPFPATSDARTTSVGSMAIERFLRPVCYQNLPDYL